MGRLRPSIVMQPNCTRRADRAKKAKETINKVIPDILRSSPRARHGVHKSVLVTDPPPNTLTEQQPVDHKIRIRLQHTDTLTAARRLTQSSRRASLANAALIKTRSKGQPFSNVCILNMASPLRPGGGFLDGATSQEEFLCMRTTLYPSLWDDFYRLPEVGGVYTPDVLVHRECGPDAEDLSKRDRFFVDVVSAAMIRFPETSGGTRTAEEKAGCSCGVSYCDRDRELVTRKMRAVLRMAQSQGAEKLILGAWGCGAYGNPVKEVAKIWKRVLCGSHRKSENWSGIKEVVFAIPDRTMLREFERCFSDVLSSTGGEVSPPVEAVEEPSAVQGSSDEVAELVSKIQETEMQLDQFTNPRSRARLREVIDGLNQQLARVGNADSPDDDLPLVEEEEEFVIDGFASSDVDENSYYNFDEDDIASSSGSSSPTAASLYEFRFRPGEGIPEESPDHQQEVGSFTASDSNALSRQSSRLDETNGWFAGSINGLSALLNKTSRVEGSPVLRPDSMGNDMEPLDLSSYVQRFANQED